MTTGTQERTIVNGIDTQAVRGLIDGVTRDAGKALSRWEVTTTWAGGTRSDSKVDHFDLGGKRVNRDFTLRVDEPFELGGTNKYANPQEYLLAALNACMIVGYTVGAAMHGIELTELSIRTRGDIDIRGFLGVSKDVKPGYDTLRYTVRIKGNGTPEQFQKIHETVMATSPNRWNIGQRIKLEAELELE